MARMSVDVFDARMTLAAQKALPGGPFRSLNGARSELRLIDSKTSETHIIYQTLDLIEAPNWFPDQSALMVNGRGRIFRIDLSTDLGAPAMLSVDALDIGDIQDANNDHVLSPDGQVLYISAGGAVFGVPSTGGEPQRLTPIGGVHFFLHGVSPDGRWLACTTIDPASRDHRWGIQLVPSQGGKAVPLLVSAHPVDGPEWSPDGEWIWFNGELDADAPGHSQIFRMRPNGNELSRMIVSPGVDWFPHPSPDGLSVIFLRYPKGTLGHPADKDVEIWLYSLADGALRRLAAFRGGQGSFNVNSWSKDSRFIAYVAYPLELAE